MTKNQIIEELYRSKEFNDCIGKMDPPDLRDDLKSEVMLILLEKGDDEIMDLYELGKLRFYTVRIILNLIQSNTSPFYKKFRLTNISAFEDYPDNGVVQFEMLDKVGAHGKLTKEATTYINVSFCNSELHQRLLKEMQEDKAIEFINAMPDGQYDKEIVKLYLKLGNYRAIEKETSVNGVPGIPWESCYCTVQKVIKQIREHVNS